MNSAKVNFFIKYIKILSYKALILFMASLLLLPLDVYRNKANASFEFTLSEAVLSKVLQYYFPKITGIAYDEGLEYLNQKYPEIYRRLKVEQKRREEIYKILKIREEISNLENINDLVDRKGEIERLQNIKNSTLRARLKGLEKNNPALYKRLTRNLPVSEKLRNEIEKFKTDHKEIFEHYSTKLSDTKNNLVYDKFKGLLGHSAFYIGMGLPVIGTQVFDIYNFLGFVGTNFLLHEISKLVINEEFWSTQVWRIGKVLEKEDSGFADELKEKFESLLVWDKALGVKLIFDKDTRAEISAYVDWKGNLQVIESPHHRSLDNPNENFLIFESIERYKDAKGEKLIVKLNEELYRNKDSLLTDNRHVPSRKQYRYKKSKYKKKPKKHSGVIEFYLPHDMKNNKKASLGERIRVDFKDMEQFKESVYINNKGRKKFLFNKNYATKMIHEGGGFSQETTPFEALRTSATVFVATPIAFSMGEVLRTLSQDHVLSFAPMMEAPLGLYAMFIVGGMYGLSSASTIYEFIAHTTWKYSVSGKSFLNSKIPDKFISIMPGFLKDLDAKGNVRLKTPKTKDACKSFFASKSSYLSKYNPNMKISDFGKIMESTSKGYTYGRLYTGLLMGGILTLAFRNQFGYSLDAYIKNRIDENDQNPNDFIEYDYEDKNFEPEPKDYKYKFMPDISGIQKKYLKQVSEAKNLKELTNSFRGYLDKIGLKDHQKGIEKAFDEKTIPGASSSFENRKKHILSFIETNALGFSYRERFLRNEESYE